MRQQLLLFLLFQVVNSFCPTQKYDDYSYSNLVCAGQCRGYWRTTKEANFDAGRKWSIIRCNEIQSLPIIIHNDEQYKYWDGIGRQEQNSNRVVPMGLLCNTTSKLWYWADGSPLDYKPPGCAGGRFADLDKPCVNDITWVLRDSGIDCWNYIDNGDHRPFPWYCISQLPPLPTPAPNGCDDFEDYSEDGVCYQVGTTTTNWQDAQNICRNFNADLASIHNDKANSFIRRLAISRGKVNSVFIGAKPSGKGNQLGWIDGSKWDYDNFYPGFPINGLGECVAMDTEGTSGQWANVDCSSEFSFACSRNQTYSSPPVCSSGPFKEGDIIYSPGYPYDASTPCDFILSVDTGKKVQIEIFVLEANTCCDRLIIFENYMGGTVIANLTGEVNDRYYRTSTSNFMRVSWQPNGGVNVRGMMMTFKGV